MSFREWPYAMRETLKGRELIAYGRGYAVFAVCEEEFFIYQPTANDIGRHFPVADYLS